jgi:CDP-diacylglycerol--glycerol-3-phosphate 3-phosphatidyltransferase
MNLPNKLTILRMILIPVFIIFMKLPIDGGRIIALVIFIAACLTDTADGYIARKYDLVTDFGKFMDPLADKLLVCAAMILLIDTGQLASWIVIVIISREFIISGFRLIAVDNGIVIAASIWGKIKTICQMVMLIALIWDLPFYGFWVFEQILIYASLVLTIVSLIDYLIKNRQVLSSKK